MYDYFSWGKYRVKRLPIGVANSLDILQKKINYPCHGFEFICAYIDDICIINKRDWTDNIKTL